MTTTSVEVDRPATGSARTEPGPEPQDALTPLSIFVALLFGLPSGLIVGPLGAAGSPAGVLGMIFMVWWLNARLVPRLGVSRVGHPVRWALYAFMFGGMTSYLAGALRPLTSEEASSSDRGFLTLAAWSGIVLVTADGLRTRRSLDRLVGYVVWAGAFLAALGLIEFFTGWNAAGIIHIPGLSVNRTIVSGFERSNFRRVQGTAAHAIEFGVVLTTILPLALHYAWFARERGRIRWLPTLLMGLAVPLAVSRSAILGLAVVVLVMMCTWPAQRRRYFFMAAPVFLVVLQVVTPGLLRTLKGLFFNFSDDPSTQGRTEDYAAVAYYVQHSPILGRGLWTYLPTLYRTLDNAFLGWVIEGGFVGLTALILLQATGVLTAFRIRSLTDEDRTRDLGASLAAGILACSINFATFDALGFAMCAGTFFLLLGCVGALWRLTVRGAETSIPPDTLRVRLNRRRTRWRLAFQAAGAVVAVLLVLLPGMVRTQWTADGAVLLQGPVLSGKDINAYVDAPYLNLPADVLMRLVMSGSTQARLEQAGHTGQYTVAAGLGSLEPRTERVGQGPLISLRVRASTPEQASGTRQAVIAELQRLMAQTQREVGSVPSEDIRVMNVSPSVGATAGHGNRPRAVVAASLIGFFGAGALWTVLSRRRPRRR